MKTELTKRVISSLILIPLSFYIIIQGNILFNFFLALCYLISIYEWFVMTKKNFFKYFGIIFLSCSFIIVYLLRNYDPCCNNYHSGLRLFLVTILICIFTDIGGYIFGKFFKGPNLTKISPNKTYSGLIGGYCLPILSIFIFAKINIYELELNLKMFTFILIVSSISQIGDIIISYFKRISNIKDTGKIIPGHGGILDRIDGMIFAFPASYIIYLHFFKF